MGEDQLFFACPFYRKSPNVHPKCGFYGLRRIRDVKQHLIRRHLRPPYCPCCYGIFPTEPQRDDHVRAKQCESRSLIEFDGVTLEQQDALKRRSDSKQTAEAQWFTMWDILFPNTTRPSSAYLGTEISEQMLLVGQYMTDEGIIIVENCLKAHNAVPWMSPHNEADLASFRNRVARVVSQLLFKGISDYMGELEVQKCPRRGNPRSSPLNREPQVMSLSNLNDIADTHTSRGRGSTSTPNAPRQSAPDQLGFMETESTEGEPDDLHQAESQLSELFDFEMLERDHFQSYKGRTD